MASAKTIECSVCGEEYKQTRKKGGSTCPNCSTKNNLSSDLEIPMDIVKDYIDGIGLGSIHELDRDEIKDNLNKYMNFKTRTKTKRAELELMEIEEQIRSMRNNGRKHNGNGNILDSVGHYNVGVGSTSTAPLLGSTILKMDSEERDKLLTDLSENPEKAYVLSMLLNPSMASPPPISPLSLLYSGIGGIGNRSNNESTGVSAMSEIMSSFANSMNGVFGSILEVLTKREENAIKPTEYIKSMAELVGMFKETQSTQEMYMKSMLDMFKMILQNNTPQYIPEGNGNDIVPVMIEMFKMIMNNKEGTSGELKEKLSQIEAKVQEVNKDVREKQYISQINELKREIMELKKEKKEPSGSTEPLKQLKEQVDLLVDLGIVRKNNEPVVIKETEKGEKVVLPSDDEKKGLSIEDRIKLEEWDLKKKREMLELDLMKLREEHKLKKEIEKEKIETEADKERYKTLNSLIEGGAAVFSTLLNAGADNGKNNNDKKVKKVSKKDDELIDIPIKFSDDSEEVEEANNKQKPSISKKVGTFSNEEAISPVKMQPVRPTPVFL